MKAEYDAIPWEYKVMAYAILGTFALIIGLMIYMLVTAW